MPKIKTFEAWKEDVNAILEKMFGVSCDDLTDMPYMDMYQDGITPQEMATKAIKENIDDDDDDDDDDDFDYDY